MGWTVQDLQNIESAIKTGAKSVYYGDKRVEYMSLDEMLRARDLIKTELGLNAAPRRKLGWHKKGF